MFDRFFDCLNVSSFTAGQRSRNAFKSPYSSGADWRLKWLREDFLPYLDKWEKTVEDRPGDFSHAARKKMLLSPETLLGLRMTDTLCSFLELVPHAFKVPGVTIFLSEKLCQDPLENIFGCQRQAFCRTQALRVVGSCMGAVKGNCWGSNTTTIDMDKENKALPKRRYSRKQV